MCDQALGGSRLGIAGDELFQILALEEVEDTGPIADDFQVGVIHRQLSEPKNAAAMIDVGRRVKSRLERRRAAAGIEEFDDFSFINADAGYTASEVCARHS